ncbi:MAG: hypothetical protein R3208_21915, partial [Ketobacteraceae bacterium]|nr:hypothetical protein [Ketobacteraceae bacterium]
QAMMDKLSEFAAQVQQARDALLQTPVPASEDGNLFADLLKTLVPETAQEPASDKGSEVVNEKSTDSQKPEFDRFIDSLIA